MKYLLPMLILLFSLAMPVSAVEVTAPRIPALGEEVMPNHTESFSEGLLELLQNLILHIRPELAESSKICLSVITGVMMLTILQTFSSSVKRAAVLAGTIVIASVLMQSADSMIGLGRDTVQQLSDYGKLLFPVMTAALAAQGGVSASAALYAGTTAFDTILGTMIAKLFVPMVYLFLALCVANSALGEDLLKRMRDFVKSSLTWGLKTILTVFTTYMSITGAVSGATDATALKATRMTISSVVPVVGGILADASESVLVSIGVMKSAAGVYGILAILALFLDPFLRIGLEYLCLKATAALCTLFGPKEITGMIDDFSAALSLLLAMTGAVCLLLLISMICFLKGVG